MNISIELYLRTRRVFGDCDDQLKVDADIPDDTEW